MLTPTEENALRIHIEKLEKKVVIMQKLSTIEGFYSEFFEKLKTAPSNKSAFNEVNETYFELFGKYRYSDFNTFKVITNRNNKKIK
ncbi:hypothetical protein [Flavobacterium aestivum]|uniref:hypothetical protein n=1 Tax=Flavobacterium aestivum TaxID=3003257 RepID=UPI00248320E5|nr:hypothetical protein [Flavobacterium aestivum]